MPTYEAVHTPEDVRKRCAEKEGATLDFKARVDLAEWWELGKDIGAFANYIGGVLLVGVQDKTGVVVGLPSAEDALRVARRYDEVAATLCRPQPMVTTAVIDVDGKPVVAVNVPPYAHALVGSRFYLLDKNGRRESNGAPSCFYLRIDDDNVLLTPDQIPMFLNATVRRTIVLLEAIPEEKRGEIIVHYRTLRRLGPYVAPAELPAAAKARLQLNVGENTVEVTINGVVCSCPIDDVERVWRDTEGWCIRLSGFVMEKGYLSG